MRLKLIISLLALILLSCDAMASFVEPPMIESAAVVPIIITSPSEGDSFNEEQYIYIYWSSSECVHIELTLPKYL